MLIAINLPLYRKIFFIPENRFFLYKLSIIFLVPKDLCFLGSIFIMSKDDSVSGNHFLDSYGSFSWFLGVIF